MTADSQGKGNPARRSFKTGHLRAFTFSSSFFLIVKWLRIPICYQAISKRRRMASPRPSKSLIFSASILLLSSRIHFASAILWPFMFPSYSSPAASTRPSSILDYFPKITFREPLVMGYRHYKRLDFGNPDRALNHDFMLRIGPEPVPFYKKSPPKSSAFVSSHEVPTYSPSLLKRNLG